MAGWDAGHVDQQHGGNTLTQRNTTKRDKHRAIIRSGRHPNFPQPEPPCYHCGEPIDYDAHHLDPASFQIDHLTPLAAARDGEDLDVLENLVPSHRSCNRAKGATVDWQPAVTFVTDRCWWS